MTTIYGLCDPVTGELRYVGKTTQLLRIRLSQHARSRRRAHLTSWIRSLSKRPSIFAIEEVDDDGCEAERHHIAAFKALGARLVNHTPGGEGNPGLRHTEEAKRKIGAASKGNKYAAGTTPSAETRARISAALKGRKMPPRTPEWTAKITAKIKGAKKPPRTEAHRAAISASKMGNQHGKGHKKSPEVRARIAEKKRLWWAQRKSLPLTTHLP